jgi:hypothetical protein
VEDASYLNTIGDAELRCVWIDPDFNPEHQAFLIRQGARDPDAHLAAIPWAL